MNELEALYNLLSELEALKDSLQNHGDEIQLYDTDIFVSEVKNQIEDLERSP